MRQITYQEAFQTLRQAGFAGAEIDRLYHLHRSYRTSELDQASPDLRRLVTTGRLTDQLPRTKEQAAPRPNEDAEGGPLALRVRSLIPLFRRKERVQV